MFSGNSDKKTRQVNDMPSIIAKGLVVSGNMECAGELQIDGIVVGDVRAEKLTLGETAHITGEIDVDMLVVHGKIDGNICAIDVTIAATGRVKGDVLNSSLNIDPGAIIDGHCRHSDNPRGSAETVALFDKADAGPAE